MLGNLTAENASHRLRIATMNAIDPLLELLVKYYKLDSQMSSGKETKDVGVGVPAQAAEDDIAATSQKQKDLPMSSPAQRQQAAANTASDVEQVMIKLIRLLANLAISREIGPTIATTKGIETLQLLLETKAPATHEELILNVVGAITNLSYYGDCPNYVIAHQLEIAANLAPLLVTENEEAVIESVRAFGNFSRNDEVRSMILTRRSSSFSLSLFSSLFCLTPISLFPPPQSMKSWPCF